MSLINENLKNHFEVFLVTSKKQGNGITYRVKSWVIFNEGQFPVHTFLSVKCQLWPRFHVRNSTVCSNKSVTTVVTLTFVFYFKCDFKQLINYHFIKNKYFG
jgi:hypothetical protein